MEQTLGKRIAANRKRLGMTQDQLADQLGVTAQAVSKWENDQSCPDITALPKLAEIFGISTDELLGRSAPVFQAEIVQDEDSDEDEGIHIQKGNWEMKWEAGRRSGLAYAAFVLLVGVLMLLDALMQWGVGFWSITWPSFLLVMGGFGLLRRFSFFNLGCTLFGGYFLISNLGLVQLNLGSKLVFPVILVLFGISLLADALRKPKKPKFHMTHWGNNSHKKAKSTCRTDGEYAEASLSFCDAHRAIFLPRLSRGDFSCSFGELTVDFSGCEEIADNCLITASCSFGAMVFLVPKCYRLDTNPGTTFGSLEVIGSPNPETKGTIRIDASVSFGSIEIHYI